MSKNGSMPASGEYAVRPPYRSFHESEMPPMPWQEHSGLKFKDADKSGWAMDPSERANLVLNIEEYGSVSEDDISDWGAQADMFGEASLTESEQYFLSVGIDKIIALEGYMEDIGRPYDFDTGKFGAPMSKMEPRDRTKEPDTGRYLQIDYDGKLVNVYEHVPDESGWHEFWGVDKDHPNVEQLILSDDKFTTVGVYEGRPFQEERDARAEFLNKDAEFQRIDLANDAAGKNADYEGVVTDGRKYGTQSAFAELMARNRETDEREQAGESEKTGSFDELP